MPKFPIHQTERQKLMEAVSRLLRPVLPRCPPKEYIEYVRVLEYELLIDAPSQAEYLNPTSLALRVAATTSAHPEWGIPLLKVAPSGRLQVSASKADAVVVDLTADDANGASSSMPAPAPAAPAPAADPTLWRSYITEEIRQTMIYRVEKMLRLVSGQLNISTVEDLNCKIQQYEMGLVISSNSLEEYMDKATLPRRLASLVTDFSEYKKTLTLQEMLR